MSHCLDLDESRVQLRYVDIKNVLARYQSLSLKNWGEVREPGNICIESCWLLAPGSGRYQSDWGTESCVHDNLSILSRNLKNELVKYWLHTSKGGEKQFSYVQKGGKTKKSPWLQCTVQVITLQGHGDSEWCANHKMDLPQLYVHSSSSLVPRPHPESQIPWASMYFFNQCNLALLTCPLKCLNTRADRLNLTVVREVPRNN